MKEFTTVYNDDDLGDQVLLRTRSTCLKLFRKFWQIPKSIERQWLRNNELMNMRLFGKVNETLDHMEMKSGSDQLLLPHL